MPFKNKSAKDLTQILMEMTITARIVAKPTIECLMISGQKQSLDQISPELAFKHFLEKSGGKIINPLLETTKIILIPWLQKSKGFAKRRDIRQRRRKLCKREKLEIYQ